VVFVWIQHGGPGWISGIVCKFSLIKNTRRIYYN
jgi:hypothetical protein